jgi:hypothetical protein
MNRFLVLVLVLSIFAQVGRTAAIGDEIEVEMPLAETALEWCNSELSKCEKEEFFPLADFDRFVNNSLLFWRMPDEESANCASFQIPQGIATAIPRSQVLDTGVLRGPERFYGHCLLALSNESLDPYLSEVVYTEPDLQWLVGCDGCEVLGFVGWLTIPMFRLTSESETFEVELHSDFGYGNWRDGRFYLNVGNPGDVITVTAETVFYHLWPGTVG